MCQTSLPSDYHVVCKMINSEIPCTAIYSKPYDHGTLYAMILKERLSHRNLSSKLDDLDKSMRVASEPERTRFRSIFMDPFNGKIKTFSRGKHGKDYLFNVIFKSKSPGGGRKLIPDSDVNIWYPDGLSVEGKLSSESIIFDVVKKRKAMDAAPPNDEDDSADALAVFEEFERSVLPALGIFRDEEEENRKREMVATDGRVEA